MQLLSPLVFNLVARQQWNFPSEAGTLYLHLRVAWLVEASSNQLNPVWSSLVCMTNRNSMACHITSDLDFNKGGCVIQI